MEESKWVAVAEAVVASIFIVALVMVVPLVGLLMIPVVIVRTVWGALASQLNRSPSRLLDW